MRPCDLMPIEQIADWEKRIERHDAFWQNEIVDRPFVSIAIPQKNDAFPVPVEKMYESHRDRWFDVDYVAERAVHQVMNTDYLGDALPYFNPNLGPEVLTAFMGMDMEFGESTSWGIPNLENWDDINNVKFSEDNFYYQKMQKLTDALLDAGKGKFYVGLTDFHPGGDGVAAFRDPMNLNIDMLEYPEKVKELVGIIEQEYFKIFDKFYHKLTVENKQATTSWAGIVSSQKWYVPSNDFSCMISPDMFDDIFLPGLIEECKFYENSIYHLDGPDALRHLDSLLKVKELNAIQWVYGAGNGRATDWLDIYKKCQAAGKGIQLHIQPDELDCIMDNLKPNGVWMHIDDVFTKDEADYLVNQITGWTA